MTTQLSLTQLGLDPECKWTEEALGQKLGVIQQTINSWISDIRARKGQPKHYHPLKPPWMAPGADHEGSGVRSKCSFKNCAKYQN
jgi:hypothetical protein